MAKDKKSKVVSIIPEGMKCYKKIGGGSLRFPNRIIKSGQKFWVYPESIPEVFKSRVNEVTADTGAVVVIVGARPRIEGKEVLELVPDKFEMVKALDDAGKVIKKGNSNLYNVVGADGKALNDKPLRKGKAEELLESLNA